MGKPHRSKLINCTYFTWKLFKRGQVYYADGRTNSTNLGKHSLMARQEDEAMASLRLLDQAKAIEQGLAVPETPATARRRQLEATSIADGWSRYMEHCTRPEVMGGVSPGTYKRYRAVRNKHVKFCEKRGTGSWCDVGRNQAEAYGQGLADTSYAARTIYLELTLLVSVNKWLIENRLLSSEFRFKLNLTKPTGTDTHCYTRQQVDRMLSRSEESSLGRWIRPILITLASTRMRVGELVTLRWRDIDFDAEMLRVVDDRFSSRKQSMGSTRTTKGKRSRALPLNAALRNVLSNVPKHPDGRVFHGPQGASLRQKTILTIFKREVRDPLASEFPVPKGEIGFEHGTIHSFRHYFVSECFRQGATEAEVKDWVGHRDSRMVHHYRHLRPDDSHRRMQTINFLEADAVSTSHNPMSTGGAAKDTP